MLLFFSFLSSYAFNSFSSPVFSSWPFTLSHFISFSLSLSLSLSPTLSFSLSISLSFPLSFRPYLSISLPPLSLSLFLSTSSSLSLFSPSPSQCQHHLYLPHISKLSQAQYLQRQCFHNELANLFYPYLDRTLTLPSRLVFSNQDLTYPQPSLTNIMRKSQPLLAPEKKKSPIMI